MKSGAFPYHVWVLGAGCWTAVCWNQFDLVHRANWSNLTNFTSTDRELLGNLNLTSAAMDLELEINQGVSIYTTNINRRHKSGFIFCLLECHLLKHLLAAGTECVRMSSKIDATVQKSLWK